MQVHQLGTGEPELAIVGGIHGDEPCGVRAVERLLEEAPDVAVPVALVIANEPALERGVRYVDEDMNRCFPGDPDAESLERRLAAELVAELAGCRVLSLHSTQSQADPFALVDELGPWSRELVPRLPVSAVVETGPFVDGRIFAALETIEVECGLQRSADAAENAVRIAREFLVASGALPGDTIRRELPAFRLTHQLPKPRAAHTAVHVANFEEVRAGQRYATADDREFAAEEPFFPVLCSAEGYEDVFGYAAESIGTVTSERNPPA